MCLYGYATIFQVCRRFMSLELAAGPNGPMNSQTRWTKPNLAHAFCLPSDRTHSNVQHLLTRRTLDFNGDPNLSGGEKGNVNERFLLLIGAYGSPVGTEAAYYQT